MEVDLEQVAHKLAKTVSVQLNHLADHGGTEADFRRGVASVLEKAAEDAGLIITPRDEFSVARGRVDSLYNRLILEYKRPGILRQSNEVKANKDVIDQVKDYIRDVAKRERREATRLAGVALDGKYFIFVRQVGEGWSVDDPVLVNATSTEKFLRLLFSLCAGAALVPDNLIEDFGPRHLRAQRAVRAIHRALDRNLKSNVHPLVGKLFEQWRTFFSEATDYKEWATRIESKAEFRSFVSGMAISPKHGDAPAIFFALHTYYALLIKLVASMSAAQFAGGENKPLKQIAGLEGEALREWFRVLEHGGLFREYGIRNFLEGDFFGWYLTAWDDDIEYAVQQLVQRLAEYDPGTLELAPENARDLLKNLYHRLLPKEIRHDLGEYYTPDWLAERLIRQTLGPEDLGDPIKRVLDPSCGSGTFLVILIKLIRERAEREKRKPKDTLKLILQNVIGIDLNPLAVIAARTNYLLALGDLLKHRDGDIDIPVYQADSILTPSQGSDLFTGTVYPLKTSAGVFRVPASFATQERMDALANVLDEAVETGIAEKVFMERVEHAASLWENEAKEAAPELKALYKQLKQLHDEGLNGVWARIMKNAFAPLFLEPCHYVVGNPPWVNWENLPDEYRHSTKPLWEYYGLFPHSGMDTILGKGKKDISMLMTYVAVDRYLLDRGKLGFVLSQSLFKTSGAGQGFRRFELPEDVPFCPVVVDDMVELKPFEGAANRTVVGVFAKNRRVRYPVPYPYWVKREEGRGSAIGFDTPYDAVTKDKITFRDFYAQPIEPGDPTSAWITARKRALIALRSVWGKADYTAHEGCNCGGANAVYWVEIVGKRPGGLAIVSNITDGAKRQVASVQSAVETEMLFPLLRGRDVKRWYGSPSAHILMAQDPKTRTGIPESVMSKKYPKAYSYFKKFESDLKSRKTQAVRGLMERGAFYSMFGVGEYTFSTWKVVWPEVGNELTAAVVGKSDVDGHKKPVIPDHTCVSVECTTEQEAHYLCAVLNSSPARLTIRNYVVLHPSPHVIEHVRIPQFERGNKLHIDLSELSKAAHSTTITEDELEKVEKRIDERVTQLWGLSVKEIAEIRGSLEEL